LARVTTSAGEPICQLFVRDELPDDVAARSPSF
jgi:hypothetical protein